MRRKRSEAFEIQGSRPRRGERAVAEAFVSLGEKTAVTDGRGEFRLETTGAPDAVELVAIHPGFLPGRFRADRDPASGKPIWPDEVVLKLGGLPLSISRARSSTTPGSHARACRSGSRIRRASD
jgi:hypothetical protein